MHIHITEDILSGNNISDQDLLQVKSQIEKRDSYLPFQGFDKLMTELINSVITSLEPRHSCVRTEDLDGILAVKGIDKAYLTITHCVLGEILKVAFSLNGKVETKFKALTSIFLINEEKLETIITRFIRNIIPSEMSKYYSYLMHDEKINKMVAELLEKARQSRIYYEATSEAQQEELKKLNAFLEICRTNFVPESYLADRHVRDLTDIFMSVLLERIGNKDVKYKVSDSRITIRINKLIGYKDLLIDLTLSQDVLSNTLSSYKKQIPTLEPDDVKELIWIISKMPKFERDSRGFTLENILKATNNVSKVGAMSGIILKEHLNVIKANEYTDSVQSF